MHNSYYKMNHKKTLDLILDRPTPILQVIFHITKHTKLQSIYFPRQKLKIFTFHLKSSLSIFFFLGLSPFVNNFGIKVNLLKSFMWKTLFYSLRNYKET